METSPVLYDLLAPGLNLVVCGTAAGAASARRGLYYAGAGNKFWRTLASIGLTDRELLPTEYRLLHNYGIGLTDLVKHQAGADVDIRFGEADRSQFREQVLRFQPAHLCFNGKRAAQEFFETRRVEYGVQDQRIGKTNLFVAPSTSAAANGAWDLEYWLQLAGLVRAGRPGPEEVR